MCSVAGICHFIFCGYFKVNFNYCEDKMQTLWFIIFYSWPTPPTEIDPEGWTLKYVPNLPTFLHSHYLHPQPWSPGQSTKPHHWSFCFCFLPQCISSSLYLGNYKSDDTILLLQMFPLYSEFNPKLPVTYAVLRDVAPAHLSVTSFHTTLPSFAPPSLTGLLTILGAS